MLNNSALLEWWGWEWARD